MRLVLLVCWAQLIGRAQMTMSQKINDFKQLVALYERSYAPAEWKKEVFGFDLFDTAPWLERVEQSTDDIGFYEICAEYVASLNDTHSSYTMPSNWSAALGFTVDIYDGHVLVDSVNRDILPANGFPFQVGDELLSVDGVDVETWIQRLVKWAPSSNTRTRRSMAAQLIVSRYQVGFPRAPLETGDSALLQIRRQNGAVENYDVKWIKSGNPVITVGPVWDHWRDRSQLDSLSQTASGSPEGSFMPIFSMPRGFQQRLGAAQDFFFSGTFSSGPLRIGYLRIPVFVPTQGGPFGAIQPISAAIAQLAQEIAYMQAHTDGLVLDVMHNPGGDSNYMDAIYSYLSPGSYQSLRGVYRPTLAFLAQTEAQLAQAKASNAPEAIIAFYQKMLDEGRASYARGDALTPPFPLIGASIERNPATDSAGHVIAYTKPIMLLTDDLTVSAADAFAAIFQDNLRGIAFGIRTNGAGGNSSIRNVGAYSDDTAGIEINLNVRNRIVSVPGYPPTAYFDSVGVQPDIVADLMTKADLLTNGAVFSRTMVSTVTHYIQSHHN